MLLAVQFTGSGSPLSAIAVAVIAYSVAACSADVYRFDNNTVAVAPRSVQPQSGLSPTSLAQAATGPGATLISRPKSELANGDRSADLVSPGISAGRVAGSGDRPVDLSQRRDEPSARLPKRNNNTVVKAASLTRGTVTVIAHRPPAQPAQKAAKTRSGDTRTAGAAPIFHWPVHGKIFARFGPQPNGKNNDGIAIAVEEGTPIRSAEDGVVIYAGNGLKGLGNLVLVRHANQYVTVYAHAKELKAKRGDQIKRGDVIGSSGQTGNFRTPQLYFEVRKNATPVDPLPFLKERRDLAKRAASAIWPRGSRGEP